MRRPPSAANQGRRDLGSGYFSDEQRKHTRLAAELSGLNAVRLINEPRRRQWLRPAYAANSRSLFSIWGRNL